MPKAAKAKKKKKTKDDVKPSGSISKGDMLLIETEIRLERDNLLIDTTNRELAEKEGIYSEDQPYGPQLIVVGEGWILPKIDADLVNLSPGDEKEYLIEPSEAFGEKDASKIRTFSIREFKKANIDVRKNLGRRIDFKGKKAIILGERGGRVKVDFNHPYAGNSLKFKLKINKKLESDEEIIDQIILMRFRGLPPEKIKPTLDEKSKLVTFNLPTEALLVQGLQMAKFGTAQFILKQFKKYERVRFIEEFSKDFFEPKLPEAPQKVEKEEKDKEEEKKES
ncbi:MAG: peptidylprolyl isomerase [Candidatus Helarchaeota archaeon]